MPKKQTFFPYDRLNLQLNISPKYIFRLFIPIHELYIKNWFDHQSTSKCVDKLIALQTLLEEHLKKLLDPWSGIIQNCRGPMLYL